MVTNPGDNLDTHEEVSYCSCDDEDGLDPDCFTHGEQDPASYSDPIEPWMDPS